MLLQYTDNPQKKVEVGNVQTVNTLVFFSEKCVVNKQQEHKQLERISFCVAAKASQQSSLDFIVLYRKFDWLDLKISLFQFCHLMGSHCLGGAGLSERAEILS